MRDIRKEKTKVEENIVCPNPECRSTRLRRDEKGELVCRKCDTVVSEAPMQSAGESGPRTTFTRADKGLGTKTDKRVPGHRIGNQLSSTEQSFNITIQEIKGIVNSLGAPKAIEESAILICKNMIDKKFMQGRNRKVVSAAAVYAAYKLHKVPRTFEEIAGETEISKKEIARTYKVIRKVISKEKRLKTMLKHISESYDPRSYGSYVARFCGKLRLDFKVEAEAKKILTKADEKKLSSGIKPAGAVATAIYLACRKYGERKSMDEVAAAAGVSEVAIRNKYKDWNTKLDLKIEIKNVSRGKRGKTNPKKIEWGDINDM